MTRTSADVESGRLRIRDLETEVVRLRADRDACIAFIKNEVAWCGFRAEWLDDNVSVANAKKLADFLDRHNAAEVT